MNGLLVVTSAVPTWEEAPPLVIGDVGYAHSYNGKIYFVGSLAVQEYDPDIGSWVIKNNEGLGAKSTRGDSALIGDKIYIITTWMSTAIYDIANNSFAEFPTSKTDRIDIGVGTTNGELLVAGGWLSGDSTSVTLVETFNPDNNSWQTITPMLTSRKNHKLVTAENYVYAVGGYSGFGFNVLTRVFERYNPATQEWENLTAVPYEYRSPGITAIQDGRIIVADMTQTSVYNPMEDSWITGNSIIDSGVYYLNSLANLNNTVYSIGAIDGDDILHGFVWTLNLSAPSQIPGFELLSSLLGILVVISFLNYRRKQN